MQENGIERKSNNALWPQIVFWSFLNIVDETNTDDEDDDDDYDWDYDTHLRV